MTDSYLRSRLRNQTLVVLINILFPKEESLLGYVHKYMKEKSRAIWLCLIVDTLRFRVSLQPRLPQPPPPHLSPLLLLFVFPSLSPLSLYAPSLALSSCPSLLLLHPPPPFSSSYCSFLLLFVLFPPYPPLCVTSPSSFSLSCALRSTPRRSYLLLPLVVRSTLYAPSFGSTASLMAHCPMSGSVEPFWPPSNPSGCRRTRLAVVESISVLSNPPDHRRTRLDYWGRRWSII